MDNETNTVVIISCFVGLLIEIWKINKAVDIKVSRLEGWSDKKGRDTHPLGPRA